MKILIAPDSFKGTLTAKDVCEIIGQAFKDTIKIYRTNDGEKFNFRTINETGKVCLEAEILL